MLRSMYAGVSGLRVHQKKLDVIGNNIANVNTVAYKSSSVTFQEVLSQTISSSQSPSEGGTGGINPYQVGLGATIGSISTNYTNGNTQSTDNPNDLSIDGEGFFVVSDGTSNLFTRAGNFSIDSAGSLVTVSGEKVQGWNKGTAVSIDTTQPLETIDLSSLNMPASETTALGFEGNIDSEGSDHIESNMTIYDSLGESHTITVSFDRTSPDNYDCTFSSVDTEIASMTGGEGEIVFTDEGIFESQSLDDIGITFNNGSSAVDITAANIVFNPEKFTQFGGVSSLFCSPDGYPAGNLIGMGIDSEGSIIGNFSNGRDNHVATIALATVTNPQGMEKMGGNLYATSWNSGDALLGAAGADGRGSISSNSLEMSNVDLSREFTEMIVAQRGFQANSKIITTSDEVLQELVNLKR